MTKNSLLYRGFRHPAEIISHVVWLYFRFSLSFRDIEELMASRGIIVTYETIRQWTLKFGQGYANELRRRQPQRGDKWHLDEVVLTIKGRHHYRWRAVEQNGHVLDILMQSRRNRQAEKRFFRKLLKGLQELRRSEGAHHARCRASPAQGSEQPGRTLAPTDAATRTTDAPLQVTRPCTALSVGTRPDQQRLPVSAQPPVGTAVQARPG